MQMKRRTLMAAAIFGIAAASVNAMSAQASEKVSLTISFSYGPYSELFDALARKFEETHPNVKITTLQPINGTHEEHLQQVLRAAVTGGLPDVSFQGNHLLPILVQRGLPVPLDPLIKQDPDFASLGLTEGAKSVGRIAGATYGLGFQSSAPAIFYNSDLLTKAGGDPEKLPKTWPEIVDLAKRIKAQNPEAMGGYFDYASSGAFTFQAIIRGLGGEMMKPDNKTIAFNGPEGLHAMKLLKQFVTGGGMRDMSRDQAYQAFGAGTIGVMPAASSNLSQFEKLSGGRFQVLVGPWPIAANGKLPTGGRTAVIFTRDPAKQAAAWDYLKFVTGPEGQTMMVKFTGSLPNNEKAIKDPALLGKFYQENPNQFATTQQLSDLGDWYTFPGDNAVKINTAINDDLQSVVSLKLEPDAALDKMVKDVQALLPR
ncbi:ABC transporter substrate-binding protein [Microvirga sp. VF16]|uniref:ABC transporter substrate-binding protein n=1 Tax=Microvirga sp. VF16 TaxID=2807101 RepID=UPI00193CA11D|nr:ABC transporter substrate-binding protein [Microvirga sp. VF16]QRM32590.1 ABC transporter substrate-binding protein [Microvirga sp. VF16]